MHSHSSEPTWERAVELSRGIARKMPSETVRLSDAVGRVLAQDITAKTDMPAFASSAMDGWAVCGQSPWTVVGEVLAGDDSQVTLAEGSAVVIATGARIPENTRGVLRSEHGSLNGDVLTCNEDARSDEPSQGEHVRPAGEEAHLGEVLIFAGTVLNPVMVGMCASAGYDTLSVAQQPTIDVLILGDELLDDGLSRDGTVRDSLGPQLPAIITALNARIGSVTRVPDVQETTVSALNACSGDITVTTGGTARGPVDHLHSALSAIGAELIVDSVAMRPGHPLLVAKCSDGRPLVGLPGNPQSAIIGILTALAPIVDESMGIALQPRSTVQCATNFPAPRKETRLTPYTLTEDGAIPTSFLGSGMLRGLAGADGVAIIPPGGVQPGSIVETIQLPW